ncbi:MAG: hypothetical protein QOD93_2222 [Acetobacteraceae bacterium]|jgi:hypothetical protein|nr:hypothetical protein [Acetobacteraceae bacterium]
MMKVVEAKLRMYNVGFGDCLLLKLTYNDPKKSTRCVLFDFGSTRLPDSAAPNHMEVIAKDIDEECGGKLAIVVATHRHADHISGFGHSKAGPIIERLNPDVVVQPWTEHPNLATDAVAPTGKGQRAKHLALTQNLRNMQAFAAGAYTEGLRLRNLRGFPKSVAERVAFLGETNVKNEAAVRRLMTMGRRHVYAKFGDTLKVRRVLPGVQIEVLGPPTLQQAPAIAHQADTDSREFWHLAATWGRGAAAGTANDSGPKLEPLFPNAVRGAVPQAAKWLVPQIARAYADNMLSILRTMDSVLNNTSLILLIQIGGTTLLFPGDAQIENWGYALFDAPNHEEICAQLARTNVYKVGHHGSLNATPKTLWNGFTHKQDEANKTATRLISVMSTKAGKYGEARSGTDVPRGKLLKALDENSNLYTTQKRTGSTKPWVDVEIPLS